MLRIFSVSPDRLLLQMCRHALLLGCVSGTLSANAQKLVPVPVPEPRQILEGNIAPVIRTAKPLGRLVSTRRLPVTVALPLRNQAQLEQLIVDQANPRSPRFMQYLKPGEFEAQFSPTPEDYEQMVQHLQAQGLTVTRRSKSRLDMTVEGTTAQMESVFQVKIHRYTQKTDAGSEIVFANDTAPSLPASLRLKPTAVFGLSNAAHMIPCENGTPPYNPNDIATAYNYKGLWNAGYRGEGQDIVIYSPADYKPDNLTAYANNYNLSTANVVRTYFQDGISSIDYRPEADLDVEVVLGLAPKARIDLWVFPNNDNMLYNVMAQFADSGTAAKILTSSWIQPENLVSQTYLNAYHNLFLQAASQGKTIFNASGDRGAYGNQDNTIGVSYPSSDPYVIAVGGTSMLTDANSNRSTETGWSGSGGGLSTIWNRPDWQNSSITGLINGGSNGKRQVPDVALNADVATGYRLYFTFPQYPSWQQSGGTSCSAPAFAAGFALIEQSLNKTFFLPPLLYQSYAASPGAFYDILSGNNGAYGNTVGWDYVTGLGSVNFTTLRDALNKATSTGTWTGRVTDANGQPLANAELHLFQIETQQFISATTSTNASGQYQFNLSSLPNGHYHLGAYLAGYNTFINSPNFTGYVVQNGSGSISSADVILGTLTNQPSSIFGFTSYSDASGVHYLGSGVHIDVYNGGHLIASADSRPNGSYRVNGLAGQSGYYGYYTYIATFTDGNGVVHKTVGINFGAWPGLGLRTDINFAL